MSTLTLIDAGGTISSREGPDGALVGGDETAFLEGIFSANLPPIARRATYAGLSEDMTLEDAMDVVRGCRAAIDEGAPAIVVAHGTDTMEEVAFLADLFHGGSEPILFTGAQRAASLPGSDGPANLRDAAIVADSPASRDIGVAIVFGGRILSARSARKIDSSCPDAFGSTGAEIGRVDHHGARILAAPRRRPPLPLCTPDPSVAILALGLGNDAALLDALIETGLRGVIVDGFGAGNIPMRLFPAIERACARGILIGIASQCVSGGTAAAYESGVRLAALGAIGGGDLSARKLRLLFSAALGDGRDVGRAAQICRSWLGA